MHKFFSLPIILCSLLQLSPLQGDEDLILKGSPIPAINEVKSCHYLSSEGIVNEHGNISFYCISNDTLFAEPGQEGEPLTILEDGTYLISYRVYISAETTPNLTLQKNVYETLPGTYSRKKLSGENSNQYVAKAMVVSTFAVGDQISIMNQLSIPIEIYRGPDELERHSLTLRRMEK